MHKQKIGRKFNRKRDARRALLKSLARNLIWEGRIQTTEARAKELRPYIERLVTKARNGGVAAIRYLKTYFDDKTVFKLINEISVTYHNRQGGYTRIIKKMPDTRNAAARAIIEFVQDDKQPTTTN